MPRDAPVMNRVLPLERHGGLRESEVERYASRARSPRRPQDQQADDDDEALRTNRCRRAARAGPTIARDSVAMGADVQASRAQRSTSAPRCRDVDHASRGAGVQKVVAVAAYEHEDQQAAGTGPKNPS